MFITINGQLGSGKSEVCKILKKDYGYDVFSTGSIQRAFAKELGISTLELNELCNSDTSYDFIIDKRLVDFAESNRDKDIIFDSRMAWHFVKNAFRVHLLVSPKIAAERVFYNRHTAEEKYSSVEHAMDDLIARLHLENERYFQIYGVIPSDYSNYDVIIDTSDIPPYRVVEIILSSLEKFRKNEAYAKAFVSPKNIFPIELPNKENDSVEVVLEKKGDELYVIEGANRVLSSILSNISIIPAIIKGQTDNQSNLPLDILKQWECEGNFSYSYYPQSYY